MTNQKNPQSPSGEAHDDTPRKRWYQRPWFMSPDGHNVMPTSWIGLVVLAVVIVAGVGIVNWIGSLF
ncbi:hypothetical protein [Leucobacter massiliensis]|uniref:Uncharacterized protein n=1 Tax=Leucobacter massiliensis TaxID=1686285 RepID=A0A2S9QLQ7_9MICO|nr:hypothetical protein [Leucobacter massiliensis]PRI10504.1 hypothetical protein B4915_10890 [Leucobacter massiliensis]